MSVSLNATEIEIRYLEIINDFKLKNEFLVSKIEKYKSQSKEMLKCIDEANVELGANAKIISLLTNENGLLIKEIESLSIIF